MQLCHRSLAGTCKSDRAYLSVPEPSRRHLLKCEWHPPVHRKKEPKRDIHRPRARTHTHIRRHGHAHDCFIFYTTPTSSTRNAPDFQASHGRRAPRLQRTHCKTQRRWALHLIHRAPHSTRRSLRAPYRAQTSARGQANRVESSNVIVADAATKTALEHSLGEGDVAARVPHQCHHLKHHADDDEHGVLSGGDARANV